MVSEEPTTEVWCLVTLSRRFMRSYDMTYRPLACSQSLRLMSWRAYVDVVNRWPYLGSILFCVGDHVTYIHSVSHEIAFGLGMEITLLAGYSNRKDLVPNSSTSCGQELGKSINLIALLRVCYLLVIATIATRIFPIDVLNKVSNSLRALRRKS
jgi:hypothetical protein